MSRFRLLLGVGVVLLANMGCCRWADRMCGNNSNRAPQQCCPAPAPACYPAQPVCAPPPNACYPAPPPPPTGYQRPYGQ